MISKTTQDTDEFRQKPLSAIGRGTADPYVPLFILRIVRTFSTEALFIPVIQSAYCLLGRSIHIPNFSPQNPASEYGCVGIPFTASGSPCFGNSPKASGGHLILKPHSFPLKGEAPVIRLTKMPVTHSSSPAGSHKPQIPPGTCAPSVPHFFQGRVQIQFSPAFLWKQPEAREPTSTWCPVHAYRYRDRMIFFMIATGSLLSVCLHTSSMTRRPIHS